MKSTVIEVRPMFFSPCHITAVFHVHKKSDALHTGTTGYGFCIDSGVKTAVEKGGMRVFVNGEGHEANVTRKVCELLGIECTVRQEASLPSGHGFGISGAAALSTALEVNNFFELGLSREQCGQAAHCAEAKMFSGLGDVISSFHGGVERRAVPGAPGIGTVEKQDIKVERVVVGTLEGVPTKEVLLRDVGELNSFAAKHIAGFKPTPEYYCDSSLAFAREIDLVDEEFEGVIKAIQKEGVRVGVSMLGKTLFSFDNAESVFKKHLGCVAMCGIDSQGARKC